MKCARVRDKLMDYTSADLLPSESQRINEHLMDCEACRKALESARNASRALDLLGIEAPAPSLVGGVRARLEQHRPERRPVLIPRLAAGFSAAVLVALVVAGWMRYGSMDRSTVTAVKPDHGTQSPIGRPSGTERVNPPSSVSARDTDLPAPVVAVNSAEKPASVRASGHKRPRQVEVVRVSEPDAVEMQPLSPSVSSDAGGEKVMMIAVRPREPEIYVQHFDSEDESSPAELTVVREFDEGGNITSVTIRGESMDDSAGESDGPAPDRTQLLDAPLPSDTWAGRLFAGGSVYNA